MRPEDLVGRAHHEVGADGPHVDPAVLRQVDPVARDDRRRALVHEPGELGGGGDRADGVRRERERDDLGAFGQRGLERRGVERRVVVADVDPPDGGAGVLGGEHPRPDVGVVVEPRHHHLVAGPERPPHRARDREQQRRRVRTEDHLVRVGVQQVGRGPVGLRDHLVGLLAGGERAVRVGVAAAQVRRHRLDHGFGDLGAAGRVDEHGGPPVQLPGERGEPGTDVREIGFGHGARSVAHRPLERQLARLVRRDPSLRAGPGPATRGRGATPSSRGRRAARGRGSCGPRARRRRAAEVRPRRGSRPGGSIRRGRPRPSIATSRRAR